MFSYHGCKSFIYKHTIQRKYCCCQTKTRQLDKEGRSHKGNKNILSTYFETKKFNFQLKILPSNQRLRYGNNMRSYIHKYLHV